MFIILFITAVLTEMWLFLKTWGSDAWFLAWNNAMKSGIHYQWVKASIKPFLDVPSILWWSSWRDGREADGRKGWGQPSVPLPLPSPPQSGHWSIAQFWYPWNNVFVRTIKLSWSTFTSLLTVLSLIMCHKDPTTFLPPGSSPLSPTPCWVSGLGTNSSKSFPYHLLY